MSTATHGRPFRCRPSCCVRPRRRPTPPAARLERRPPPEACTALPLPHPTSHTTERAAAPIATPSSRQRLRSCRPVALAVVVAAAAAELDHGLSSAWSGASSGDSTHTRGETGQAGFECSGTPFDEQFTTCSGRPGAARGCRRAATIAAGDRNRSSAAIGRQPPDLCTASCWAERHVHPPQQRTGKKWRCAPPGHVGAHPGRIFSSCRHATRRLEVIPIFAHVCAFALDQRQMCGSTSSRAQPARKTTVLDASEQTAPKVRSHSGRQGARGPGHNAPRRIHPPAALAQSRSYL